MISSSNLLAIADELEPGQSLELKHVDGKVAIVFSRVVKLRDRTVKRHRATAFVAFDSSSATKGLGEAEVRDNYLGRIEQARESW